MRRNRNCSIWLCSNKTEKECLERNLFGDKNDYGRKKVKIGDICFLYNFTSDNLIGVFIAVSNPSRNLEPEAWGGDFPYQIRVKPIGEIRYIRNASRTFMEIGLRMIKTKAGSLIPALPVYGPEITQRLVERFPDFDWNMIEEPSDEVWVAERPSEGFNAVAGLKDVKEFIRERMIEPLLYPHLAEKYRLRIGGGVLLYGPPGTGKTLIARATAKEIDAELIEISPSVVRGFPGEPERYLERIFEEALQKPRVVIFIDEAEALLAAREIAQGSTVMQRVIPTMLSLFTKIAARNAPVLIIAATNKPGNIDEAFLRPGRLDLQLKVPLPDQEARVELLRLALAGRPISRELKNPKTLMELANKMDGWTGADIHHLIDRVALNVFKRQVQKNPDLAKDPEAIEDQKLEEITRQDIEEGIESGLSGPSVSPEQIREIDEWEKRKKSPRSI